MLASSGLLVMLVPAVRAKDVMPHPLFVVESCDPASAPAQFADVSILVFPSVKVETEVNRFLLRQSTPLHQEKVAISDPEKIPAKRIAVRLRTQASGVTPDCFCMGRRRAPTCSRVESKDQEFFGESLPNLCRGIVMRPLHDAEVLGSGMGGADVRWPEMGTGGRPGKR